MNYCVHNEIMRMQNYMRKHYWHPIGVEDVAKSVGYSPRRANLLYQDCTGETIGDYLRFLRMEDAKVHLQHKIPIERVALSLSYTPRGFLKTFRNYFGVSPSQYAKNGHLNDRYVKHYEYVSDGLWGRGENPTPDGLWEFSCYDPAVKKYFPMKWSDSQELFLAPPKRVSVFSSMVLPKSGRRKRNAPGTGNPRSEKLSVSSRGRRRDLFLRGEA